MKFLKQLIFMSFVAFALATTTMAQRQDDNKNRPPKVDPPKIDPKDKPKDRPKDNDNSNRPKKPEGEAYLIVYKAEIGSV